MKVQSPSRTDADLLVDPSVTEARVRRSLLTGAVLIASALVGTLVLGQWRTEQQLQGQLLLQARAFTKEIVATRQFVARHGGVFVPESAETTLNPYLRRIPGIKTRIRDESGTVYVLQNPSLVVRNVNAEMAGLSDISVRFHMASDRPLNPYNMADAFELQALEAFAEGEPEYSARAEVGGRPAYRYVLPLEVESSCVKCHFAQGWRPGEVRGGISVTIDSEPVATAVAQGRAFTALALLGSLSTLLFVLYLVSTRLLGSLLAAESRLRELATRDSLTGLENRRVAMRRLVVEVERAIREQLPIGVLMLDLDHFKDVNDSAGHAVGDAVLTAAASGMAAQARPYDTVARIGGEEFLAILPGVDMEGACAIAERMRAAVVKSTALVPGVNGPVTVSAGAASIDPDSPESAGDLLRRADRALYGAKDAGRDRVVCG